ncbi:MAG: PEP-CTERM sorting domain-containing protein [Verrucomicrobiae bacterium]|nr:PEP-CTERM sorting domain-containing protein [Verrucomicrobiae bacterium]
MKPTSVLGFSTAVLPLITAASVALSSLAGVIDNVVETGGDNEPTDTILAKWSGQTWAVTIANEPVPGLAVGDLYTAGLFGSGAPAYVDRNHRYLDDLPNNLPIPGYLVGFEYIMSGNDNRDNPTYRLDVTVNQPVTVYMLIDNRLSDGNNADPPTFGPTSMQWILDGGWIATANGFNRAKDPTRPDEVPIDESADGTINQYFSVYYKNFDAGTFSLYQADNSGRNMYGVVVAPIPEPSVLAMICLGGLGLALWRRARSSGPSV